MRTNIIDVGKLDKTNPKFRVNAVSNSYVRGESYAADGSACLGVRGARLWFFAGYLVGFLALFGATGVLAIDWHKNGLNALHVYFYQR